MLILIRGLPGSGKSTKAQEVSNHYAKCGFTVAHVENDQYLKENGKYLFTPERSKIAREQCLAGASTSIAHGVVAIVANTFTKYSEMVPYFTAAERHGVPVKVIEMNNTFKSTHDVPDDVMETMKNRWESYEVVPPIKEE